MFHFGTMDMSIVIGRSPFSSRLKLFVGYCVVAVVVVVLQTGYLSTELTNEHVVVGFLKY